MNLIYSVSSPGEFYFQFYLVQDLGGKALPSGERIKYSEKRQVRNRGGKRKGYFRAPGITGEG